MVPGTGTLAVDSLCLVGLGSSIHRGSVVSHEYQSVEIGGQVKALGSLLFSLFLNGICGPVGQGVGGGGVLVLPCT